jgi:hypothetical protein
MRGAAKGQENAQRLAVYFAALRAEKRGLPARDGRPNLSVIAHACGFDRGVFYANQTAKVMLDDAVAELGLDDGRPYPANAFEAAQLRDETKVRGEGRSRALEDELLRLRAENAQLRAELVRLRAVQNLMANMGRMP